MRGILKLQTFWVTSSKDVPTFCAFFEFSRGYLYCYKFYLILGMIRKRKIWKKYMKKIYEMKLKCKDFLEEIICAGEFGSFLRLKIFTMTWWQFFEFLAQLFDAKIALLCGNSNFFGLKFLAQFFGTKIFSAIFRDQNF